MQASLIVNKTSQAGLERWLERGANRAKRLAHGPRHETVGRRHRAHPARRHAAEVMRRTAVAKQYGAVFSAPGRWGSRDKPTPSVLVLGKRLSNRMSTPRRPLKHGRASSPEEEVQAVIDGMIDRLERKSSRWARRLAAAPERVEDVPHAPCVEDEVEDVLSFDRRLL